jgi:selenium metabolism protein YedF
MMMLSVMREYEVNKMEIKIDARGLACPKPVIETKKALDQIPEGNIITLVDNAIARDNVSKLAKSMQLHFTVEEADGNFQISIFKGEYVGLGDEGIENRPNLSNLVMLVASDVLGEGERELGEILMKGYFYALAEYEPYPKAVIFMNAGVKLAIEGSPVLEHVKRLQEYGTEVMSCGTCLDYYGIKALLGVGEVSNMYTIVEYISEANNTIKL